MSAWWIYLGIAQMQTKYEQAEKNRNDRRVEAQIGRVTKR